MLVCITATNNKTYVSFKRGKKSSTAYFFTEFFCFFFVDKTITEKHFPLLLPVTVFLCNIQCGN